MKNVVVWVKNYYTKKPEKPRTIETLLNKYGIITEDAECYGRGEGGRYASPFTNTQAHTQLDTHIHTKSHIYTNTLIMEHTKTHIRQKNAKMHTYTQTHTKRET